MKSIRIVVLLVAAAAVGGGAASAQSPKVDISMNVFPTNVGSPNSGGTWTLVAKTDSPHGIVGISFWVLNVDIAGMSAETDIGNSIPPYFGTFSGIRNLAYFQDFFGAIVVGVGTPAKSDGPDPLGDPTWDGATRIISGTYSSAVPSFSTAVGFITDANTLPSSTPPFFPALAARVSTKVRVIPEPRSAALALACGLGLVRVRRRS